LENWYGSYRIVEKEVNSNIKNITLPVINAPTNKCLLYIIGVHIICILSPIKKTTSNRICHLKFAIIYAPKPLVSIGFAPMTALISLMLMKEPCAANRVIFAILQMLIKKHSFE
jgi:hypothetical protein